MAWHGMHGVSSLLIMYHLVHSKSTTCTKCFVTNTAIVRLFSSMKPFMIFQFSFHNEWFPTFKTFKWFFKCLCTTLIETFSMSSLSSGSIWRTESWLNSVDGCCCTEEAVSSSYPSVLKNTWDLKGCCWSCHPPPCSFNFYSLLPGGASRNTPSTLYFQVIPPPEEAPECIWRALDEHWREMVINPNHHWICF